MSSESQRLREIRAGLDAIAPADWSRAADDLGEFIEARDEHGALINIARFQPGASFDEITFMADAPRNVAFLLGLVDRAIFALRAHGDRPSGPASAGAGARPSGGSERERSAAADRRSPDSSGAHAQGQPRSGDTPRERDFAAEAAMKCSEPAFKAYLAERHGLEPPLTDDRAAQKLRSVLSLTSRRDLNEDGQAASRWKRLRGDFYAWRKAG